MPRRHYWLFKSEPDAFSIDDLAQCPEQTTHWDGVRNYQARNFLRDEIQEGDGVLFYHSRTKPLAVVGSLRVVRSGYPDHTACDPQSEYYDEKSDPEDPTWYMVDVQLVHRFEPVTREALQACAATADMMVLKRGMRLSIQPVTADQWKAVHRLAGVKP